MTFVTKNAFSSKTFEWATPQPLFDALNREFHFELDVCATPSNAKCARFYSMAEDGVAQPWTGICFCNPPYGRLIAPWLAKARDSALAGATANSGSDRHTLVAWHCREGF